MDDGSTMISRHTSVFEAWLDAVPFPLLVHDNESIVFANLATCQLLGATDCQALFGIPIEDIVHPDARDAGRERRRVMFEQGHMFASIALKLMDTRGEAVKLIANARRFQIGDQPYIVIVAGSEIEMPAWEASLGAGYLTFEEGTSLAEAALRSMPSAVFISDRDRLQLVSHAAAQLVGARPTDLEGAPVSALMHADSAEAAAERRHAMIDNMLTVNGIQAKLKRVDGNPVYVRTEGRTVQYGDERAAIWWVRRAWDTLPENGV